MKNLKAIHFDLDGVISDSEHLHEKAEKQTCIDHGIKADPSVWGEKLRGKTSRDIFAYLIDNYGDPKRYNPKDLVDHKSTLFIKMAKTELKPIDGVKEFLQWAREQFEKTSLVTSSNKRIQSFTTEHLDINHFFDAIVNGDDITEGKPSPQPYSKILDKLGLAGHESLVVEDSVNGIRSAKAAGCRVLAIATSHSVEELQVANPDYIAADYSDAKRQLLAEL